MLLIVLSEYNSNLEKRHVWNECLSIISIFFFIVARRELHPSEACPSRKFVRYYGDIYGGWTTEDTKQRSQKHRPQGAPGHGNLHHGPNA